MLKLNTILTALAVVLLALLGFLGKAIWDDVAIAKSATISASVKMEAISHTLDDHEQRIRSTERDVTMLQQERHDFRPPKLSDNKPN